MLKRKIINEVDDARKIGDIENELNLKYRDWGIHDNKGKDNNLYYSIH